MNEKIILDKLMKLAEKAKKMDEIPVSAIVIHNNHIISQKYNLRERKKDITAHAEVLALKTAAHKLKRWNLSDCDLYVSLKPCSMCEEIIKQSRIRNVYYLLDKLDYKHDFAKTKFTKLEDDSYSDSYQHLFSSFFKNKR